MSTATQAGAIGAEAFYANQTLFGFDPTPGIVAVELGEPGTVRVWRRVEGRLVLESAPFHPFVWLENDALLDGGPAPLQVRSLEGGGTLRRIAHFADPDTLSAARKHLQKASGETPGSPSAPYRLLSDLVHMYLLECGRTFFKGMTLDDISRMQIELFTQCDDESEFANPQREEDRILAISITTNRGFAAVLAGEEKVQLQRLTEIVAEQDPDIIEGHDIFRFTLEYLRVRAQRHKIKLLLGRDGTAPSRRASRLQIAERTIDYPRYDICGRHVLDTWLLAQYYDISDRSLPSFDLLDVARHTGAIAKDADAPKMSPRALRNASASDQQRALCKQPVLVAAISRLLSPIYFLQAQMFPYSFQNVIVRGNATRIDSLFLREYLRRGQALPSMADSPPSYEGGYTDIFEQGVLRPVLQVDVQSLYPSLMLTYGLKPRADELGIFLGLLKDLFDFRVRAKSLSRSQKAAEEHSFYNALQSTFKILINSFYGYLGTSFCHFADAAAAAEVTRHGRELVRSILDWLRSHGARPVEADTDGVYFIPPADMSEEQLLVELQQTLPQGIRLELGGRYAAMFSHKAKNYALLDSDGAVIIRGSGLRSRGMEKYLRDFLEDMLGLILREQGAEMPRLLEARLQEIADRKLPIEDLCKTETLSETLDSYKKKLEAKKRNAAAAYELALSSGRKYKPGDTVSYYVCGQGKKVKVYECSRPVSAWSAAAPDENVEYYQQKLVELARKFEEYWS